MDKNGNGKPHSVIIQPNLWGQPQRLGPWKEMVREYLVEQPDATPQPVVAPVEAGARPQGDAPEVGGVVLDALPLAEYRLPAPHLSAGPAAPTPAPHEPRVSPRGKPIPPAAPVVTRRPSFGSWWANKRYE